MDEPKKNFRDYTLNGDYSLKTVCNYGFIDRRILKILHSCDLYYATQIHKLYLKRKPYIKFPGLGIKSGKILSDFLDNFDENMEIIRVGEMRKSICNRPKEDVLYRPDLEIFDFVESKLLNKRCRNILIAEAMLDINGLLLHYRDYGHFNRLRNCGEKSNEIILTFIKAIEPKLEQYKIDANG